MARILVVEDSADIADLIAHYLTRAHHEVERLTSGADVLPRVRARPPDLIVLDVMLPDVDGFEVCRGLRADAVAAPVPIIMLTARGEEGDRVRGLEVGADDYVTKPFSPKELVARVAAMLRRIERPRPPAKVLTYGPLSIDRERHLVLLDTQPIQLTAKEFLLLQYFLEHPGRVLSRDLLLSDVWGYRYTGGTRTVDIHVRRLREKLPLLAASLTTIKQFGYKLEDAPAGPR